ncbi:MAG: toll/interleukin-1 receptor domain-containing protein [Oscillospiraceae bacterium]|nr:toll/interleukin-1 receptor domain-containing protein [Oscillospiraceae bacterium]
MPSQVFISYKNTDNGVLTRDAEMARELYDALTAVGVSCFFATESLRELGQDDYAKAIDSELDSCSVLVVVATTAEHIESQWVRYEWYGFHNDLLSGRKRGKLFTYVDGLSPNDLPRALRQYQSFEKKFFSLNDIVTHIVNGIKEINGELRPSNGSGQKTGPSAADNKQRAAACLEAAEAFIKLEQWEKAEKACEEACELTPQDCRCWWGRIVSFTKNFHALRLTDPDIEKLSSLYESASAFMSESDKDQYGKVFSDYIGIMKEYNSAVLSANDALKQHHEEIINHLEAEKAAIVSKPTKSIWHLWDEPWKITVIVILTLLGLWMTFAAQLFWFTPLVFTPVLALILSLTHNRRVSKERTFTNIDLEYIDNILKIENDELRDSVMRNALLRGAPVSCSSKEKEKAEQELSGLAGEYAKFCKENGQNSIDKWPESLISMMPDTKESVSLASVRKEYAETHESGKDSSAMNIWQLLAFVPLILFSLTVQDRFKIILGSLFLVWAFVYPIKRLWSSKIGPQADNILYEIISCAAVTAVQVCYYVWMNRNVDSLLNKLGLFNLLFFGGFLFCMLLSALSKLRRIKKNRHADDQVSDPEKIAKKLSRPAKAAVIIAVIAVLAAAVLIFWNRFVVPYRKYREALWRIEINDPITAFEYFVELRGFLDSRERAEELRSDYEAKQYRYSHQPGNTLYLGTYEQDNRRSDGTEFIEWTVLASDEEKLLVISKYALDCRGYHSERSDVTWETSALREWLNGEFLNTAFTPGEIEMIADTAVTADSTDESSADPGNDTVDKVFLLSVSEAQQYFDDDSERQCSATAYCSSKSRSIPDDAPCDWWLRTLSDSPDSAMFIYGIGTVGPEYGSFVDSDFNAVRPAMWIMLND